MDFFAATVEFTDFAERDDAAGQNIAGEISFFLHHDRPAGSFREGAGRILGTGESRSGQVEEEDSARLKR